MQTSCNYLNELLKPVEQLFHQAFRTASAALPCWQWCSTELHPPKMASGLEEQPPCPETQEKEWSDKINDARRVPCVEQVTWLLVVSYMTCSRSAGAMSLTRAHLSALSERFGVDTSLGTAEVNTELSDSFSQAMASHQSSLLGLCC